MILSDVCFTRWHIENLSPTLEEIQTHEWLCHKYIKEVDMQSTKDGFHSSSSLYLVIEVFRNLPI